jgi:pimeloyl-ACP methyl ester carboxylesterase
MKKNKLLQISTLDRLYLHGYYVSSENKKAAVLHIHGMESNFYQDNFIHALVDELEGKDIGFLTVNTRGNGRDTDFNTVDGDRKRIGSRYEMLEEAHLDIAAWLEFLIDEGYKEIVLEGHSAGTLKVVRYLFEGELKDKVNKLILLSPIDPLGFRKACGRNDIEGFLKKAQAKVDEGNGDELITPEFDHDALSYKTFISWYKRDDLGRMFEFCSPEYDFPILKQITIPTKVITGSKDEYFHPSSPEHPEEAMDILLKSIPNSKGKIIESAVHSFKPHEDIMVREVSKFILENK